MKEEKKILEQLKNNENDYNKLLLRILLMIETTK